MKLKNRVLKCGKCGEHPVLKLEDRYGRVVYRVTCVQPTTFFHFQKTIAIKNWNNYMERL
jgi:hypothetical protein